jgi:hypothetical protein
MDEMDPDTRQREGADAGADKQSAAGRRHPRRRDDNPEVACLAAAEGHPEEIWYVQTKQLLTEPPGIRPNVSSEAYS